MYICDRCGKGRQSIMSVSHSHRRTQKSALPNLHKVTVTLKGQRVSLRLCTKCTRLVRAEAALSFAPKKATVPASS